MPKLIIAAKNSGNVITPKTSSVDFALWEFSTQTYHMISGHAIWLRSLVQHCALISIGRNT